LIQLGRPLVASAGRDGTVRVWDPATATPRHTLIGHIGGVGALVAAPDGTWLASSGGDGTVRVWDPVAGAAVTAIRVDAWLSVLSWSGDVLASAGERPYLFRLTLE
jgi:WD40 repeat protein